MAKQRTLLPEWPELPATRGFLRLELPDYFRERSLCWPVSIFLCPVCQHPMNWWSFKGVQKWECPFCEYEEKYREAGKMLRFLRVAGPRNEGGGDETDDFRRATNKEKFPAVD